LSALSITANWSYTNAATVWPLQSEPDGWGGSGSTFGAPYQIACTWAGADERMTGNSGHEFVPKVKFWHEDSRVKYGDWIAQGVQSDRLSGDEIQSHTNWDMSFFGELPDYMSVT
jgi:hypothetical protein